MKTRYTFLLLILANLSFAQKDSLIYPQAPHTDVQDTIWDTSVSDPFRTLESDTKARQEWLDAEKKLTDGYFKNIRHLFDIEYDYRNTLNYTNEYSVRTGPYYIEYHRNIITSCLDIYYKDYIHDEPRFLYSPSMISANISRFSDVKISADGKYCALMYSPDGSDWQEIRIYNMITMALIKDHIKNVRYSTITWFQNGFFYNKFDSVNENKKYTDVETNQKIYYHKLGTDPLRDSIVFEDKANPFNTFGLVVTEDERFIIVHERFSDKNKNITYFKDSKKDEPFKILVSELNSHTTIIGSKGDTLFALSTNGGAYNGKLIEIDTKKPNAWAVISDNQEKYLIKQAVFVHDTFCLIMKESFNEYIAFISRDGEIMKTMKFPPGSDNEMICYSPDQNSILISKSYFVCPPVGDLLSMKDFTYKHRQSLHFNFNSSDYNFYVTNYSSKDGTLIPIYVVMKKGALKKGPSPTLINVYGGFDITPRPSFDPAIFTFLNNGGIYALANIRGGSNSVKDWHTSGAVLKKQNSIDDTYYAARFLIDSGFAQADKVAITGSSNGGLVVAATINQHPETFRVALLNAGVYDMIRLENYTAGVYYENEYGSIDDSLQFKNLLSYSPLHNVKENTTYPSMWITTSDFDDRVPPFHTYKYVAALQKLTHSKNPILLKVILNEGHSPSSSSFTKALTKTLFYSFLFNELGMKYKPSSFYDNKGTD